MELGFAIGPGVFEYAVTQEIVDVISSALGFAGIVDRSVAVAFADRMAENRTKGRTSRQFIQWAGSASAPAPLNYLNPEWIDAIEFTVGRLMRPKGSGPEIPGWSLDHYIHVDAYACRIRTHRKIDGFKAKIEDPIWKTMIPPFDWMCGCSVLVERIATRSRHILPTEIVERAARWRYTSPRDVLLHL